jgi:type I restriction enzyme S subunit
MTPHDLIARFDELAEAPNGIDQLRQMVLQLGLRGALVSQDKADEPANLLLQRIAAERQQRRRRQQPRENATVESDVPEGWVATSLGEIIDLEYGKSLPEKSRTIGPHKVYGSNGIVGSHSESLVDLPIVVVGRKGSSGSVNIARGGGWPIDTAYYVVPRGGMSLDFVALMLLGCRLDELDRATAIPGLNREDAYAQRVLLPPLGEQKRIVARVDELMKLIDQLEVARTRREQARVAFRDSALSALQTATTTEEVDLAWTRVRERFEDVANEADVSGSLRSLVLRLAVDGRLVGQEAADGGTDALLMSMRAQLTVRARERSSAHPAAALYEIPPTWRWARFDEVAVIASNLVSPSSYPDAPHVAPDNIEKRTGRLLSYRTIREDGVFSSKNRFFSGQILYSKIRPNLSKVVVVDFEGLCSADMYPIQPLIDRGYLHLYMLSVPFLRIVTADENRLAMPKVNQEQLSAVPVAVPPLAEQRRIVARVDELMKLIDQIERAQRSREEFHAAFASAAVHHLDA